VKRLETQPFPMLSSIHFNDDLEVIGDATFYNANLHFSVELPSSLREIGNTAFLESALEGEVVIPENCLTLGYSAFSTTEITKMTFPSRLEEQVSLAQKHTVSAASPRDKTHIPFSALGFAYQLPKVCFWGMVQGWPSFYHLF
jgi:hypothetical protein